MLHKMMLAVAALLVLQTVGCAERSLDSGSLDGGELISDGSPAKRDIGPRLDSKPPAPDTGGPLPPGCPGCRDYVFSQVLVPVTSADVQKYALVHNGKRYNALGNIISLLASQAPTTSVADSVANSVNKGKAIILIRLQADSMVNDPSVRAQVWLGAETKCCSATYSPSQCAKEAAATCFNGQGKFSVHPTSPKDMFFSGSISGGQLRLGPARMKLRMSMSNVVTDLPLKHAQLQGAVSDMMINGGVLTGAIPKADLEKTVIPQLAKMLDQTYKSADKQTAMMIKQLFDLNNDGTISTSEVANNALIKTFLSGDVDIEPDGENELSIGIGYSAVSAKIVNQ